MDISREQALNIGILGGTFNPIHIGHMELAMKALKQFNLDRVYIMPNNLPDYKENYGIVEGKHRLAMADIACMGHEAILASDFELKLSGYTYTANTLTMLHEMYPLVHWYFIMGADSIMYFEKWKKPEVIAGLATLVITIRDDLDYSSLYEKIRELEAIFSGIDIQIARIDNINVSSSEIRQGIKSGKDMSDSLPEGVYSYIMDNHLYQG